ncbi:neuromedin-U isoform X3 [Trachypithecus francoisi]|uniref:neuromedin-U isoform X3 n=1 Tax=Trachypithecus francoisi TaxID=54180 RepID=UPI00141A7F25|nr:neuromedin-U isoform X3 [Trachypithecus francoisi]
MLRTASSPRRSLPGQVAAASPLLLLLLLACCAGACGGAPIAPQGLQPAQQLQLWNEIDDACSSFLSIDSQPQVIRLPQRPKVLGLQASNALEELCFVIMGMLPKPQEQDEKDNTKRFLFHYSKTQKLGNSNVVEEFQNPFASQSRGYFLFRPRNGRRSAAFI